MAEEKEKNNNKIDNERLKIKLKYFTRIIYAILSAIILIFVTWIFFKMPESDFPVKTYTVIVIMCLTSFGINSELVSLILKLKDKK